MTTLNFFIYLFLVITLIAASVSDNRKREVSHWYWIPYVVCCAYPIWEYLWLQPFVPLWWTIGLSIGGLVVCTLCSILYASKVTKRLPIGFADGLAFGIVCMSMPVMFGISSVPFILLGTLIWILILYQIPGIKREWDERGIPLLIPLTCSTIANIGLVYLF